MNDMVDALVFMGHYLGWVLFILCTPFAVIATIAIPFSQQPMWCAAVAVLTFLGGLAGALIVKPPAP